MQRPVSCVEIWTAGGQVISQRLGQPKAWGWLVVASQEPGWYPDPADPSRNMYWDGRTWHRDGATPLPGVAAVPPAGKKRHPILLALGALILFGFLASQCGSPSSDKAASSKTSSRSTAPSTQAAGTSNNDAYIALLKKWATRDGYAMGDRELLLEAGHQVCVWLTDGVDNDLITASAHAMRQFSLPGKEASAVGVAATETLCPEHNSLPNSSTPRSSAAAKTPIPGYEGTPSAAPVTSKLVSVTLPAGTTTVGRDAGTVPGIEIWHIPLEPAAAIDYLKVQLPTGPYEDLPACPVDTTHPKDGSIGITQWAWENNSGSYITVSLTSFQPPWMDIPGPGSEVTITRGKEDPPDPC